MDFLLWLQSFRSPLLDAFFTVVNATAEDNFITALAVILFWCADPLVGLRFLLPLLFSGYLNTFLKDLLHTSRPTAEQVLFMAVPSNGSYAFPSGHTQNAAVLWSYLAGHYRKKALVIVTVVMIPLVGLSRIYRGAHWPVDVLGGMAIGAALVWLALTIYRFWDHRSLSPPLWGQVALGVAVPLALFAVYPKTSLQTGSALGMIVGAANSGITLVRDIVLSDVIDEDELRTGRRREGSYFGVNAFIERLVMVLIGGSSSLVLGLGGYDAELTTQPPSVALGIRLGMGLLPVVALAVFLAALKYYPLGKEQVVALRGRLEALH